MLRPESHGTVRLASLDPRAAPLIDPAFLSDPRDMAVMKAGVRATYRILEQQPLARHLGKDRNPPDLADDDALERLIRARADTVYHPVGTARMGTDDGAVCDPEAEGARCRRAVGGRRQHHAQADLGQHQRALAS